MREFSMGELINRSIQRTRLILLEPFSIKKWLKLMFIAWLAGALGVGGGSSSYRGKGSHTKEPLHKSCVFMGENVFAAQDNSLYHSPDTVAQQIQREGSEGITQRQCSSPILWVSYVKMFLPVIIVLVLFIIVLFAWLGARFKFVWFNAIVNNDVCIREPFSMYRQEGNSLFKILLLLGFIFFSFLALLGLWVYFSGMATGVFAGEDVSFMDIIMTFLPPLLLFVPILIVYAVINVCIDDFVVPIMAIDRCSFMKAAATFINVLRTNGKDFLLYFLVIAGLGIITVIITFIISLILLLAVFIVGLILGLVSYGFIGVLLKARVIGVVLAGIVGLLLVVVAILLRMSINLPFAVFFRNFSLYFMSSLNCGYQPLPLENAASSE